MSESMLCSRCNKPKVKDQFRTCGSCRKRNNEYRKRKSLVKDGYLMSVKLRRGIIAGRKNCRQCKCWRPISDFPVSEWQDKNKLAPKYLNSICHTCARINARKKETDLTGQSGPYLKWHTMAMSPEEKAEYQRKRRAERRLERLKDEAYVEDLRERKRFYEDKRRRAQGLPTKEVEPSSYQRAKDDELVPIKPFQEWIERRIEVYGCIEDFATAVHASPRSVHRWRTGRELGKNGKERVFNKIPLNTVDLAVTREGTYALWEIYPELYK